MPWDLVVRLMATSDSAARNRLRRWRQAGWVESLHVWQGPMWVYATAQGVALFGRHQYRPGPPSVARLDHLRAVTEARVGLLDRWADRDPDWRSERELRWLWSRIPGQPGNGLAVRAHIPDAEVVLRSGPGGPVRVAIEVELTNKGPDRTLAIMRELFAGVVVRDPVENRAKQVVPGFDRVVYVVRGQAVRRVVEASRARLAQPEAVTVLDLEEVTQ